MSTSHSEGEGTGQFGNKRARVKRASTVGNAEVQRATREVKSIGRFRDREYDEHGRKRPKAR